MHLACPCSYLPASGGSGVPTFQVSELLRAEHLLGYPVRAEPGWVSFLHGSWLSEMLRTSPLCASQFARSRLLLRSTRRMLALLSLSTRDSVRQAPGDPMREPPDHLGWQPHGHRAMSGACGGGCGTHSNRISCLFFLIAIFKNLRKLNSYKMRSENPLIFSF